MKVLRKCSCRKGIKWRGNDSDIEGARDAGEGRFFDDLFDD